MPRKQVGVQMPATLKRSPGKAQRTYAETLKSAEREYGVGERASRTAYAALKHEFEKVGDHWESKADEEGQSRKALYERAKSLHIAGRSSMNKEELAHAISKKQR